MCLRGRWGPEAARWAMPSGSAPASEADPGLADLAMESPPAMAQLSRSGLPSGGEQRPSSEANPRARRRVQETLPPPHDRRDVGPRLRPEARGTDRPRLAQEGGNGAGRRSACAKIPRHDLDRAHASARRTGDYPAGVPVDPGPADGATHWPSTSCWPSRSCSGGCLACADGRRWRCCRS